MKKILMTTALLTALAGGVNAQQAGDGMIVPEGYSAFEDFSVLTFDSLEGATIYDVNGETIGSISDIVLDMQSAAPGATTSDAELGAAAGTDMATDDMAMDTDMAADSEAGVTETDTMVDGVDTATGTQSTDPAATEGLDQGADMTAETMDPAVETETVVTDVDTMDTEVDETADEATLDIAETASDAIEDINDTADDVTEEMADGTDGVMDMDDATMDETGEEVALADGGGISHVIVDIGGFLGIGVHTVALPIEALEIYADSNDDLRIYVPWSEDQLRNLQQYDENNPDTLGTMPNAG